ncbi:MAG: TetR/AcrR family transcriptional regulator [Litoreibacter sp.]|uniref:TetR/AcrR family transcriptional regulator n=1 Tax=Litoreibacter sp. TaxID=1969459 RepID=UPI003296EE60
MARPREFDPDDAIERAMNVFWQHGYDGASLADLLAGMGLTRGSLYKAFKDKHSLFLRVLKRYEQGAVAQAVEFLSAEDIPDGTARIEAMFGGIVDTVVSGDKRGCLLCSAAAGPSSYDEDIAAAVKTGLQQMHGGFSTALAASDIPTSQHATLADLLVTQYVGLRIMSRSVDQLDILTRSAEAITQLLRHPKH